MASLDAGVLREFDGPYASVLATTRDAVTGAGLAIDSYREVDESTAMIVATKGISAWSWGELIRVVVQKSAENRVTVRVLTRRRLVTNVAAKGDWSDTIFSGIDLALKGAQVKAQAVAETSAPRSITVTGGVGNSMGWLGLQGERYLPGQRFSVFGGVGYLPAADPGDTSGPAFAAGLRAFTSGARHRGLLELSVSPIAFQLACFDDCRSYYGLGVQGGYQFVSRRGFTVLASLGVGYAPGLPDGEAKVGPLSGLGLGYTWRR